MILAVRKIGFRVFHKFVKRKKLSLNNLLCLLPSIILNNNIE